MNKTRRSFFRTAFAAGIAVAAAGCVAPLQNPPLDPRIVVDDSVRGMVVVTDVRLAPGTSDHMTMQLTIQNLTRSVLPIKYRVVWVTNEGIENESVLSTWQLSSAAPKDIIALKAVSPRPDLVNFRFYIARQ